MPFSGRLTRWSFAFFSAAAARSSSWKDVKCLLCLGLAELWRFHPKTSGTHHHSCQFFVVLMGDVVINSPQHQKIKNLQSENQPWFQALGSLWQILTFHVAQHQPTANVVASSARCLAAVTSALRRIREWQMEGTTQRSL